MVSIILLIMAGCGPKGRRQITGADLSDGIYNHHYLSRSLVEMLYQVRSDIMISAGVKADFRIVADPSPNAFLTIIDNEPSVILTSGMIQVLLNARDDYAFLIAHECAHLSQNHFKGKKERQNAINTAGSVIITGIEVIGMAIGIPLGLFSLASVESGTHLAALKYNRDQEREADRLALLYMKDAGYDPQGAVSFHEKMLKISRGPALSILSTHPSDEERLETIKKLVAEN
jgi:predicted Zn-dependent protease